MPARNEVNATVPRETRRASCEDCTWATELRSAGHTARDHVATNPTHRVHFVKTIVQSFAGSRATPARAAALSSRPDVPAF